MNSKDVEKELSSIIDKNTIIKVNDSLYLTKYQIKVLSEKHISFQECKNVKDILFLLNEITDDEEWEELDEIASQLSEYSYYNESNK